MLKRRKTALAVLAMAVAAVFVLPASSASAGTATVPNGCANSVTANFSQIQVTTSGDDGLTEVAPAGATTTSNLTQSAAIPGAIFVAGYNLGLLVVGPNNIPANVRSTIEATNTVEGSQNTNIVGGVPPNGSVTVSTTITDPDGTPGTGDETGTDASFSVTYNNLNWTAGGSGTIEYRQQSIPAWPATDASNTLRIQALVGGFLNVVFRCAPATVTPPDPGTVVLIDPAASFDTTDIVVEDTAPTANAGPDQTVEEGDLVTLDGTASSDPENEALTYNWTAPAGVTLSDPTSATPTFTAPQVGADTDLTFTLEVCDEAPVLCSDPDDTVVVTVQNIVGSAISIDDASATEGGAVDFTVSLDVPQAGTVTVGYATADGSAVAPGDYTSATGTVTFAPGDTSETVTVQTNQDDLIEGDETFDVNLSDPTGNATIADGLGVGTIIDDDVDNTPTANAGPDQDVIEGDLVTLDGTGSSDPDGEALTYAWTAPAGITLTGADTANPTFTAPDVAVTTPFTITLEVCDEANPDELCATDDVVVTVNPIDDPPTANAGDDQTVDEGDPVTLDGSGSSDPNGEALTYAWTQTGGPAVTLTGADTASPTFTAPQVGLGGEQLTFSLEVCDEAPVLCSDPDDTVTVTVLNVVEIRDAAGEVIVNGPVGPSTRKTSKSFVFKVSNIGMVPILITPADITTSVTVNGTETGLVSVAGLPLTLNPGSSKRLKAVWNYASGAFAAGDTIEFNACVNLEGDVDTTNDCGSATATAK